jgi:replicative DNA helicase
MLAAISKTPAWRLRKGLLEKDGLSAIYQGIGRLADLQIYFADRKSRTLRRIEQGICSMVTSQKVGLVIVDYLQLISAEGKSQNREREISEISGTLKSLAMQFNIPIIALSQLNRDLERRDNKRPILADLRDSGSLEQDADIVMLLYRDDYYNPRSPERGIVEINIAKGRNTGTGTIKLRWDAERQTFSDL